MAAQICRFTQGRSVMSNVNGPATDPPQTGLAAFLAIEQCVLDAVPAGLCACATDGGLLRYNRRAIEIWGRAPRLGAPAELDLFRRYGVDGKPLVFAVAPVGRALGSGESISSAELLIERPDGSRVP